jgi:hypothetical protein
MADEREQRPKFTHAVAKKALAPIVASAATAATTYLVRKGTQLWHESVQPKIEERGGAGAIAQSVADTAEEKLGPQRDETEAETKTETKAAPSAEERKRADERRKREQRRKQRRKALEQSGSS